MNTIAFLLTGFISAVGGGLECIAEDLRQRSFEATVKDSQIWVEARHSASDDQVASLSGTPYVSSIRLLQGGFSDVGVARLAKLPHLKVLVLRSDRLTDKSAAAIASLKSIEKLDLMGARLTSKGLQRLQGLPKLQQLYLHGASIKAGDLRTLSTLRRLRILTLPECAKGQLLAEISAALPATQVSIPEKG